MERVSKVSDPLPLSAPPTRIRVSVVEDEPHAARLLVELLRRQPGMDVVDVLSSADEAVAALARRPVDAVFLDVQIPHFDGFEVLRRLPLDRLPAVVFVTAHEQYARRAFEVAAVDFLLKPFDEARLVASVSRLRARLADREWVHERASLLAALEELRNERRHLKHIAAWLPGEQRAVLLPIDQIVWIEADRKHLHAHTTSGTHQLRGPLRNLEAALDPEVFVRVSRSAIVNVDHVREIQR